jgi:peptidoglycan-associated lipoprotein
MAEGRDARGAIFPITPTWSVVASGGTITDAGLFTAGTLPGSYLSTVKATAGEVSGNASVTVTAPLLRISPALKTITVTPTVASTAASLATMQELVHFEYDKSDLTALSREALDGKVNVFRANPAMRIVIVGHTDDRGTGAYNLALGTRRAEAVRDYLVTQGVASSRIELDTRGETQPVASGNSEAAMALNRRDAFRILVASDSVLAPKK